MDNSMGLPGTALSKTHYAGLMLACQQVYTSHRRHFPALVHHRLLTLVISGIQCSLPDYCSLSYLHFDHISSHLVLVRDIVSREYSFPPVVCCFIINISLKISLCVYVNRVAEKINTQNEISVTTNHCRHHADSSVKKSEQDFCYKAISSAMPNNIVTLPCNFQNTLNNPRKAS